MSVFLSVRLFLGTVPFTVSGGSCGAALRPRPKSIAVVWAGVVVVGVVEVVVVEEVVEVVVDIKYFVF